DADDKGDFGLDRFANRIRSASRRHVDHARVAIGLLLRLRYGVEDRQAEMSGAAFARRCAANHLGAAGDRLLGMKGAILAGETLADDLGALVDENGHGCVQRCGGVAASPAYKWLEERKARRPPR